MVSAPGTPRAVAGRTCAVCGVTIRRGRERCVPCQAQWREDEDRRERDEYIARVVAEAPPLTPLQADEIASLLGLRRPSSGPGGLAAAQRCRVCGLRKGRHKTGCRPRERPQDPTGGRPDAGA